MGDGCSSFSSLDDDVKFVSVHISLIDFCQFLSI